MPKGGYTAIVAAILDTPNLELRLGTRFEDLDENFAHVIYSGPIDRYFGYEFGRLGYRTLDFEVFRAQGRLPGNGRAQLLRRRRSLHPHHRAQAFRALGKGQFEATDLLPRIQPLCGPADIPYYPIRQADEEAMLRKYVERAQATRASASSGGSAPTAISTWT